MHAATQVSSAARTSQLITFQETPFIIWGARAIHIGKEHHEFCFGDELQRGLSSEWTTLRARREQFERRGDASVELLRDRCRPSSLLTIVSRDG